MAEGILQKIPRNMLRGKMHLCVVPSVVLWFCIAVTGLQTFSKCVLKFLWRVHYGEPFTSSLQVSAGRKNGWAEKLIQSAYPSPPPCHLCQARSIGHAKRDSWVCITHTRACIMMTSCLMVSDVTSVFAGSSDIFLHPSLTSLRIPFECCRLLLFPGVVQEVPDERGEKETKLSAGQGTARWET